MSKKEIKTSLGASFYIPQRAYLSELCSPAQGAVNFIFFFCNLQSGFPCLEMGRAGACNERGVTCAAVRGERSGGHNTYPLLNRRNSITL